ncbi:chemokine XC receptor 1-like [Poeciliopsis prolifica]|uniref:chemokine XC receptor 1-like n=1 Tax=Poeciliopsis prolifica TaxID=188132 RepID=UPI002413A692|nr:chemokine XC receptor 1-like [Poeciliopsis prolifica]
MDFIHNSTAKDEDILNLFIQNMTCEVFDFSPINGAVFITIFILSIIGNVLLLCILFICEKHNLFTYIFIINLACSDLIFTASVPFWAVYHLHYWVFGDFLCKFIIWMHFTGLYSSIFLLMAMTVDRFCTVVLNNWPNDNQRKKRYSIGACVVAWLISIGPSVYDASKMELSDDYYCEVYRIDEVGYYFQVALLILIPTVIIILCNCAIIYTILRAAHRTRHKALSIVCCIVVAYIICWGPYNIVLFVQSTNCEEMQRMNIVYSICRMLAFSHCWINPFLFMLTQKIRNHLLYILRYRVARTNSERGSGQAYIQNASESRSSRL